MQLSTPRVIVRKALPITPYLIGLVVGIRIVSTSDRYHMMMATVIMIILGCVLLPLGAQAKKFVGSLHIGERNYVSGSIALICFLISIFLFGLIRIHTNTPAFILTIAWWVITLAWSTQDFRATSPFTCLLTLTSSTLLGILGFMFAGVIFSLPVLLLALAYSSTLSANYMCRGLDQTTRKTLLSRTAAVCLALGPCLVMVVAALGFLHNSYIGMVFLVFLVMPVLEILSKAERPLSTEWIFQLEVFTILFLGLMLLLELLLKMEAITKYLETNTRY